MLRIGYTVAEAALVVSVPQHIIESAVQDKQITAKWVAGRAVIPHTAMVAWLELQPVFRVEQV